MKQPKPDHVIAFGLFLLTFAVYVATSPGRIDNLDGQSRYEVALNWLVLGKPLLFDPIVAPFLSVPGQGGLPYGFYGAGASVTGMPLVGLGLLVGGSPGELSRFLFSLTTPVFGALTAALLYMFYRRLETTPRAAVLWTCVAAFTTQVWPGSVATFDNVQHGFFVLAGVYLGYVSALRRSVGLAALAGFVASVPILYQEYFALLMPILAVATLDLSRRDGRLLLVEPRASALRYVSFGSAAAVGLLLALAYNAWRFSSPFENGKLLDYPDGTSIFTSPLSGALALLASPGKSVLLYSPPLILAVAALANLWRVRAALALVVVAATTLMVLFYSMFRFASGDWCWGPRYLLSVLPLAMVCFPFVQTESRVRHRVIIGLASVGLVVQVLAISVDHHRFFFERGNQYVLWRDPWAYFKQSALFARPQEVAALVHGVPSSARWFTTVLEPGYSTYAILPPRESMPRERSPRWMQQFKVFYLPRPWPFWMWSIEPSARPIDIPIWLSGIAIAGVAGVVQVRAGLKRT